MIAVTGYRTTIIRELAKIVPDEIVRIDSFPDLSAMDCRFELPPADKFVLAAGVLYAKRIHDQSGEEIARSLAVNLVNVVRLCEMILGSVAAARICIIGSESGLFGSFDQTYALSKAALQSYVWWHQPRHGQVLHLLNPPVIADSGMTMARPDYPQVLTRRRFVMAKEVAERVKDIIYNYPNGARTERMC